MTEEGSTPFREMTNAAMDLMMNMGLMDMVVSQMPPDAQQGWEEFRQMVTDQLNNWVTDVQGFGEFYDK